eukprot:7144448-Alexandrium_andersonii.AAC.1
MFWECPNFNGHRAPVLAKLEEQGLLPTDLPLALAVHGIAPRVLATCEGMPWLVSNAQAVPYREDWATQCDLHPSVWHCTVDMFGHLVRAGFDRSQVFRVPAVWGTSPPVPNVFTDGSVLHPRHEQARMGGASVVLPTAVLHDAHLVL